MFAESDDIGTKHFLSHVRDQAGKQIGHIIVIGIGLIGFQTGKFRIMAFINTFVAEVAADFKHTVKTADDQTLQIKLRSNAQIQIHVQRIVMGNERFGVGAAHNRMKHRCFYLQKTVLLEPTADSRGYLATFPIDFLAVLVHNKVNIALTITGIDIGQAVEFLRQRLQRF